MRIIALLLLIASQSRAAIALGVSGSGSGNGCGNAVASISPTAGSDLFVMQHSTAVTPTTPTCTGATCTFTLEVQDLAQSQVTISLWRMRDIPSGITAVNVSGADCKANSIVAQEVTGLGATVEVSGHGVAAWTTTPATGSLTTTSSSVLLLAGFSNHASTTTTYSLPTNSFTIAGQNSSAYTAVVLSTRIVAAGTYSTGATSSNTDNQAWALAGYPVASAPAAKRRVQVFVQ